MTKHFKQSLELKSMNTIFKKVTNCENENERFLNPNKHTQIRDQFHLHRLYSIIKLRSLHQDQNKFNELIDDLPIMIGLQSFIQLIETESLGNSAGISDRAIEEIIELIQIVVSVKRDDGVKSIELEHSKYILEKIYFFIQQSKNQKLLNIFLECLSAMRKQNDQIINETIYSQLLSKAVTKIKEFIQFFEYYLERREGKDPCIIESLIRGLSLRINEFLEKAQYKNRLVHIYLQLIVFLNEQPWDSIWLGFLLRGEYSNIFDTLLLLITKRSNSFKLAYIFNNLTKIYLRAKINNIIKFQFILKNFKFIIQRSSSFFSLTETNQLADKDFLFWFINTELKIQKGQDIVNLYVANPYALEFLLVIMIYYLHQFPDKYQELAGLMRSINLLEQSKYFIGYETLSQIMRIFYTFIQAEEEFQQFRNTIQDQAISQQFLG